jgi:hypothetical protein
MIHGRIDAVFELHQQGAVAGGFDRGPFVHSDLSIIILDADERG